MEMLKVKLVVGMLVVGSFYVNVGWDCRWLVWDRHPKCRRRESETSKLKRVGRTWRIGLTVAVWLVALEYAAVFCLAALYMG